MKMNLIPIRIAFKCLIFMIPGIFIGCQSINKKVSITNSKYFFLDAEDKIDSEDPMVSFEKKYLLHGAVSLNKKKFKGLVIIMFLIGYTPIGNPSKTLQLLCDLSIDKKRQDQRYIEKILLLQVKPHTEIRQKSKSPEKTISKMGKLPHGEFQFSETVTF